MHGLTPRALGPVLVLLLVLALVLWLLLDGACDPDPVALVANP
jgi:hypothetical protein